MVVVSDNVEGFMVAVAAACEAAAFYIAASGIPEPYKSSVAGVLGAVGVAILAFWKTKVNVK